MSSFALASVAHAECTGSIQERKALRAEVLSDLNKSYRNVTGFRSSAITTKEGTRLVYTFLASADPDGSDAEQDRFAGTTLFGGPNCTLMDGFAGIVH
jgi:hypothetical protein